VHFFAFRLIRQLKQTNNPTSNENPNPTQSPPRREKDIVISPFVLPPPYRPLIGLGLTLTDTMPSVPPTMKAGLSRSASLPMKVPTRQSTVSTSTGTGAGRGCVPQHYSLPSGSRPPHRRALSDSRVARKVVDCFVTHLA
jgi:hypothetical protein